MNGPYRLPELHVDAMTDAQREVLTKLQGSPRNGVVGPYDAWLRQPDMADRARSLGDYCRFEAKLPRDLAEMVILVVGRYWDAPYEFAAHAPFARQAGVDPDLIDALRTGTPPVFSDEPAEAVYELVTEYLSVHRIADATYERAKAAIGEDSLVDVVAIAGFYAMVCMTLNVFRIPLPEGVANPFPEV
jgi:4-carboxymuconolactone decarboxylase